MPKSFRNLVAIIISIAAISAACNSESPFERLAHARDLSASLLVQFLTATDAANKAVMSDNDEASARFAREAQQAKETIQADVNLLQVVLRDFGYAPEAELLQTFELRFTEYRELDAQVLALVVENTNRRAQRLSFGPAQQEADAFRDAAAALSPGPGKNEWHVRALAASAVAGVREIQALEALHIAEAGDAAMTGMEKRMATAESATRSALRELTPLVTAASRRQLDTANGALNRFMSIHTQITEFSRRNTNVRSLALTMNDKGRVTGSCEENLRALRDALAKRELGATR